MKKASGKCKCGRCAAVGMIDGQYFYSKGKYEKALAKNKKQEHALYMDLAKEHGFVYAGLAVQALRESKLVAVWSVPFFDWANEYNYDFSDMPFVNRTWVDQCFNFDAYKAEVEARVKSGKKAEQTVNYISA